MTLQRWVLIALLCSPLLAWGVEAAVEEVGDKVVKDIVDKVEQKEVLPYTDPAPLLQTLSSDLIFEVLMGEVAVQRDQIEEAYRHVSQAARQSGDPMLAERAAKISLFLNDDRTSQQAIDHWIERSPNDIKARRYAAILAFKAKRIDKARDHLRALIQVSKAKKIDGYVLVASALSKGGDKRLALDLMRTLVAEDKANVSAWQARAMLAAELKAFPEALAAVNKALKLGADEDKSLLLKIKIYTAQEKHTEALEVLKQVVDKKPDNRDLRLAYARLLVQNKEYKKAYEQFLYLSKEGEVDAAIQYALGILSMELEHNEDAERHFLVVKDDLQHYDEASFFLGRIAEEKKDTEAAIGWYRRVRSGEFAFQAYLRMAEIDFVAGRREEARKLLADARERWPKHAVRIFLVEGSLLKEHGDNPEQVWALFDRGLTEFPENSDLLYMRALYGAEQGRIDILEQDLQIVLKKNPKHADAWNALGYSLADQTDRHKEALGYIEKALALKPESPAIMDSMGWVYYRLGRYDEAVNYLRKGLDKIYDGEIAAHLGEVLWVSGKKEDAREVWKKALDKFSDNKVLLKTLERFGIEY